jgi:calcineurin-like phosphoesterase family protein
MSSKQKVWVISDTHFGQSSVLTFKNNDGSPLRDFKDLDEMHQTIIDNWNKVVGKGDLVLHLGDVAFSGQAMDAIIPQLNGIKYLIRGNHDKFTEGRYRKYFNRILGVYIRDNVCFTHVPVHPSCLSRWKANVHGHLHGSTVMKVDVVETGIGLMVEDIEDTKYINVCVEQINYTPVAFDELIERIDASAE